LRYIGEIDFITSNGVFGFGNLMNTEENGDTVGGRKLLLQKVGLILWEDTMGGYTGLPNLKRVRSLVAAKP
jgi:hypothetical protein